MLAELDQVPAGRARWQFSVGCAWAAARMRMASREPGGAVLRNGVLGAATLALALIGYGLVRYPGLRSEPNVWGAAIAFLVTLCSITALTLMLSHGVSERSSVSRRDGLIGGIAIGAGWLVGLTPPAALKGWVFLPLLVALLGPVVVAAVAGRRDARTGTLASLWSGITGGLIVFIVWVVGDLHASRRPV